LNLKNSTSRADASDFDTHRDARTRANTIRLLNVPRIECVLLSALFSRRVGDPSPNTFRHLGDRHIRDCGEVDCDTIARSDRRPGSF
jgi:hypothetical protein